MKFLLHFITSLLCLYGLYGQNAIDKAIGKFNNNTVPYIKVEELTQNNQFILLDTRKKEEFEVSHLKNAVWVGDKQFDVDMVSDSIPDENTPIIVYCSIGVRSEDVGEKLLKKGFKQVYNLYGGIFEWKNKGYKVYDSIGQETDRVHAFNKHWGKMLTNATKVYDSGKHKN
ncbi:rhodanese-like domain-containing protein [Arenibacter sp. BSSL-BM3]|uniref:Rhodanese-like domain-containing protein n=1 Tax=Arenibacter arenosicollis TaxID=2762274 RepID=A0ABR7QGZ1_9FLAO|nr:rhodanese-like domain-containing protein [Arenibacter arenosicollis]MBC8766453.1 rhodanese-like domain-containing protein [Arenibacter arenosicollis]